MAEATYYFDVVSATYRWDNDPLYMIDGILTNYAYTSSDGDTQALLETDCPGTDLGTITKVEIRPYGHGDGDDRIDFHFGMLVIEYQVTMPSSPGWGAYSDVTSDPQIDGWTWAKIAVLNEVLAVEKDNVSKGNATYCSKVEIRVTYTPVAGWTHKYLGVANVDIGKICGVAIADIAKVNGVA